MSLYGEMVSWLEGHINYERKPTIPYAALRPEIAFRLAQLLGRPQDCFSAIHVAGTKGKGSTVCFCEALLSKVATAGGYYSPHITDICERITINRRMVEKERFASALERIRRVEGRLPGKPTYFELLTVAAALIHAESGVENAAYEVGIGGRLDATRIVNPKVCVLTHIGFDHTDKLGPTLSHIAAEKAAIFRNNATVVLSPLSPEPLKVALQKAKEERCSVLLFGCDFGLESEGETFSVWFGSRRVDGLRLRLVGEHQRINATVAIAAVLSLLGEQSLSDESIRDALYNAWLPGRLELLRTDPLFLLDGAHNDSSLVVALREARRILGEVFVVLFGCACDKEALRMAEVLKNHKVVVCSYDSPRAYKPQELAEVLTTKGAEVLSCANSPEEALALLKALGQPVLVCGSFYLVGEFRALLGVG